MKMSIALLVAGFAFSVSATPLSCTTTLDGAKTEMTLDCTNIHPDFVYTITSVPYTHAGVEIAIECEKNVGVDCFAVSEPLSISLELFKGVNLMGGLPKNDFSDVHIKCNSPPNI
jgi:hypothetical protein